ncbi:MAG: hypothetical protein ABH803_00515 [Candidatus Micrarchaeota archaeon]
MIDVFYGVLAGVMGVLPIHYNALLELLRDYEGVALFSVSLSFSVIFFQVFSASKLIPVIPLPEKLDSNQALNVGLKTVFLAFVFSLALTPFHFIFAPLLKGVLEPVYFPALFLLVAFFLSQRNWWFALLFAGSGLMGLVSFSLPLKNSLLVLFTGFFALPALFLKESAVKPVFSEKAVFLSVLLSSFSSLFPAMTPFFIASIVILFFEQHFFSSVWAVMVSKTFFDLVSVYSLNATRSLPAVIIHESKLPVEVMLSAVICAFGFSFLFFSLLSPVLKKIDFKSMNFFIGLLLVFLVFYFDSFLGLLVLSVSFSWGCCSLFSKTPASALTGALIVPSLLFFSGI